MLNPGQMGLMGSTPATKVHQGPCTVPVNHFTVCKVCALILAPVSLARQRGDKMLVPCTHYLMHSFQRSYQHLLFDLCACQVASVVSDSLQPHGL